ncbi:Dicer-like protein 1 [Mortierella alpina]|nr:Dicer-like protein 1 [Mortierella alpina]
MGRASSYFISNIVSAQSTSIFTLSMVNPSSGDAGVVSSLLSRIAKTVSATGDDAVLEKQVLTNILLKFKSGDRGSPSTKMTPKSQDTPRNYQVEVANRASEGNVIAVSDTGTGKTLISVLLLKKMVALARNEAKQTGQPRKVAFFVVNKVPLVFQQLDYITSNSDIEARAFYGAMNVDSYDKAMWESIFQENEAIVLTGQILCNVLQRAYLEIHNASSGLIIFDECHHAVGNHCYREIMTEYYKEAHPSERPKIFGMTASPAQDKGSISFSAKQLEQTLDARIVTARYDDVLAFANRPRERVVIYENPLDPGTPRIQTTLTAAQLRICEILQGLCEQDKKFKPVLGTFKYAMEALGPWCAALIWKHAIEDLKGEFLDTNGHTRERRLQAVDSMEAIIAGMERPQLDADLSMFTDKVQKMVQILRETSARDGFCGILFVERRPAAHVLCDFLEECRRFETDLGLRTIRPAVLTGHGSKGDISRHMMQLKEQRRVLEGFRRGRFNLLVATDVAEEGLDIDRCRLVVRNDPNHLQMITQKENDMRRWCSDLPTEQLIPFHSSGMDYDDDDDDDGDDFGPGQMHELAGVETRYIVETGARVTFASAVALVHQYCSSLPGDSYTRLAPVFEILPDTIAGKWRCLLTMPANAPFTNLLSEPFSKKGRAKRAVAFQACKTLHQLGALSDRLLPHPKRVYIGDELDEVEQAPALDESSFGNSTSLRDYPIRQPQFWSRTILTPPTSSSNSTATTAPCEQETVQLFMTIFSLRAEELCALAGSEARQRAKVSDRSLCLLTSQPLPRALDPIELYFNGEPRYVDIVPISQRLDFTVEQICELHQYQELLFSTVLRNPVNMGSLHTGLRHVISPLRSDFDLVNAIKNGCSPDQYIDWAEIRFGISTPKISCLRPIDVTWERLQDMVLFEKAQAGRLYFATAFRGDLSPNSRIPTLISGSREEEVCQEGITFADFYRIKRHCDIQDLTQPLIEVERVPRSENLLQPSKKQPRTARASHARFLIPELCLRIPVSASALRSARWMISVLDRVDGMLKTVECLQELGLASISPRLMLEALTASDAEYAMNYQRLELLGDTFLKFLVSVDLFIRFPLLDEGRLSVKREARVCNSHLFKRACHWNLDRFLIRNSPANMHFNTAPEAAVAALSPELDLLKEPTGSAATMAADIRPMTHWQISNKTMADLAESTLGAAFLTGGFDLGFAAGEVLLGSLNGIACWDDFAKSYQRQTIDRPGNTHSDNVFVPAEGLGDLCKVERAIGYTFTHQRLLAEAFTHATFPQADTPCYQRLEFLGDAVLDMLVTDYWVRRYPVSGPGTLHLIKSASINNQILGVLAIHLGLHRHILHASPSLGNDICRAVQTLQDKEQDVDAEGDAFMHEDDRHPHPHPHQHQHQHQHRGKERLEGEYWDDLDLTKVLGDVLESVVGAIYVDSGWDYSIVQGFFNRAILPTLQKHLSIETLKPHPVTALTHRVQQAGCQRLSLKNIVEEPTVAPEADVTVAAITQDDDLSWRSWREDVVPPPAPVCAVLIHGQTVVTATDSTIRAARKQAAKLALASMDADPEWLDKYCICAKEP